MRIVKGTSLGPEHRNPPSDWIGWWITEYDLIPPEMIYLTEYNRLKKRTYTSYNS